MARRSGERGARAPLFVLRSRFFVRRSRFGVRRSWFDVSFGVRGAGLLTILLALAAGCARPEEPARVELRARLKREAQLSNDELAILRREVSRSIAGKRFRIKEGAATRELSAEQQILLFEMLGEPAGMFDEGLRRDSGTALRVLNAPGRSNNSEIEASQRLFVDIETLLPSRYQFDYAFPSADDFAVDLVVAP
jgi:hypothetical protein